LAVEKGTVAAYSVFTTVERAIEEIAILLF
jgi:hypothetical protein